MSRIDDGIVPKFGSWGVEHVNKQARQAYELFDLKPPARRSISEYRDPMYLSTV